MEMSDYLDGRPYPGSDDHLLGCTASAWEGDKGRCRWCNADLTGRQQRWCAGCSKSYPYAENHWWTEASKAAKKRDANQCVRCEAKNADRKPDGSAVYIEVHHKTPILGRHGVSGCHHHLDGLETLCHDCHVAEHHGVKPPPSEQLEIGDEAA